MFGKRKPAPRKATKPAIPSIHIKRSAELWLETFEQAVFVYLGEDGAEFQNRAIVSGAVRYGSLRSVEHRWATARYGEIRYGLSSVGLDRVV